MQIGMIGLGRMGVNMARRLMKADMNVWSAIATQEMSIHS
jgi:6-phosphogluconate dehydrogenase (decarboxylating)